MLYTYLCMIIAVSMCELLGRGIKSPDIMILIKVQRDFNFFPGLVSQNENFSISVQTT